LNTAYGNTLNACPSANTGDSTELVTETTVSAASAATLCRALVWFWHQCI